MEKEESVKSEKSKQIFLTLTPNREKQLRKLVSILKKNRTGITRDRLCNLLGHDKPITDRTLINYLNDLEVLGVEFENRRGYKEDSGKIIVSSWSSYTHQSSGSISVLKEKDYYAVKKSIEILKEYQHLPLYQYMQSFSSWLQDELNIQEDLPIGFINIEVANNYKGISFLSELYEATSECMVLNIEYESFDDVTNIKRTVHPYLLKEYNNRWFLFGYCNEDKNISSFPLDRIKKVDLNHKKPFKKPSEDWSKYFDHVIGVSRPSKGKPETIKIRFYGRDAKYVRTKPLHWTQQEFNTTKDYSDFSINVFVNFELKSKLIGYLDRFEILEPNSLRDEFRCLFMSALKRYS